MSITDATRAGTRPSRSRRALGRWFPQLIAFGLVGGVGFIVDVGLYNLLRFTILPDQPIGAKVISVVVATTISWFGNRHLAFRDQRGGSVLREGILFALMNFIGLIISAACLVVSHYLLGYRSQLADNLSANGVGLVLGTTFRYFAYRYVVFRPASPETGVRSREEADA